jgi:hypothetical protein
MLLGALHWCRLYTFMLQCFGTDGFTSAILNLIEMGFLYIILNILGMSSLFSSLNKVSKFTIQLLFDMRRLQLMTVKDNIALVFLAHNPLLSLFLRDLFHLYVIDTFCDFQMIFHIRMTPSTSYYYMYCHRNSTWRLSEIMLRVYIPEDHATNTKYLYSGSQVYFRQLIE